MRHWNTDRMAKLAIGIQLLILIRLPSEVFRLKYIHGSTLLLASVEPFIRAELITAIYTAVAILLYFWNKHEGTIWTAAANVLTLVVYKVVLM